VSSLLIVFGVVSGAALVFYAALLVLSLRKGLRSAAERYFALYLGTMMVWSLGALMMFVDRAHAPFWNHVMMMGVAVMPFAFYGFVQGFRGRSTGDAFIALAGICALVMLFFAATGHLVTNQSVADNGMIRASFGRAMPIFGVYYVFFQGLAGVLLIRDLTQRQDFATRNRTRYILTGLIVIMAGALTNSLPLGGAVPLDIAANLVNALIISYAISRYQLLDLTLIARKTLAYSLWTALIVVGYLLIVFLAVDLFELVGGQRLLLALLLAVPVAIVAQPIRDRAQGWVDRSFFRETYDAGLMLQRLSRQLAAVLEPARLVQLMLDEITGTMQASAVLLLRDKETGDFVVQGTEAAPRDGNGASALRRLRLRSDNPIAVWLAGHDEVLNVQILDVEPQFLGLWAQERADLQAAGVEFFIRLSVARELVGILVLGARRSEAPYTFEELRTLQTLANQAAVAVHNAWLYGEALTEKERAQTILRAAFAGIVVMDQRFQVLEMNPSAEAITGRRLTALKTGALSELLGADLARNPALAEALRVASPLAPIEVRLNGGSRSRDVLLGMTPLRGGFLLNFADITRLKEADRLKSEIVANVSHELRGPLASIKGYTELLLEDMDGNDPALRLRFLSVIDEETDRLANFINDMLDLTRLESGHVDLMLAPVAIDMLLAEVVRSLDLQARTADVLVHIEVTAGIPPIQLDRSLMHSALKNLISNAIKFSPHGATVEVKAETAGAALIIDVIDHGPGIPAEDLPFLFTKFFRGRTAREAGISGTGIGLVLAREAIQRHGGNVTVESAPGRGACFRVSLPVRRADEEEMDARQAADTDYR
jgi:signal transduction histidine kinase